MYAFSGGGGRQAGKGHKVRIYTVSRNVATEDDEVDGCRVQLDVGRVSPPPSAPPIACWRHAHDSNTATKSSLRAANPGLGRAGQRGTWASKEGGRKGGEERGGMNTTFDRREIFIHQWMWWWWGWRQRKAGRREEERGPFHWAAETVQ